MNCVGITSFRCDVSFLRKFRSANRQCIDSLGFAIGQRIVEGHLISERDALSKFVSKLEARDVLPARERDALLRLGGLCREYNAGDIILSAGDPADYCVFVQEGLASRAKTLAGGARQIVAFHLPGDAIGLQSVLFATVGEDIICHSAVKTFWVSHNDILALAERYVVLAKALWLDTLVDAAIFREWTINLGQRKARERIVHLLLELSARFEAIGLVAQHTFELPVTQAALAEAVGLSLVHVNKTLQSLKQQAYLTIQDRFVTLTRKDALITLSGFSASYLHLDGSQTKSLATRLVVAQD